MARILVVEDDAALANALKDVLVRDEHAVEVVSNGDDGMAMLKENIYDVVVLDWSLPGLSGLSILKEFRSSGGVTPVLMLTGRDTIDDKEIGLDAGADDYLTKPFNTREVMARLRALLRRPAVIAGNRLELGGVTLDRSERSVTVMGSEVHLLPTEFRVLEFFLEHPNRVFSADFLLNRLWNTESDATTDAVTTCIKRLRKKIQVDNKPELLKSVYGVGYKLDSRAWD